MADVPERRRSAKKSRPPITKTPRAREAGQTPDERNELAEIHNILRVIRDRIGRMSAERVGPAGRPLYIALDALVAMIDRWGTPEGERLRAHAEAFRAEVRR